MDNTPTLTDDEIRTIQGQHLNTVGTRAQAVSSAIAAGRAIERAVLSKLRGPIGPVGAVHRDTLAMLPSMRACDGGAQIYPVSKAAFNDEYLLVYGGVPVASEASADARYIERAKRFQQRANEIEVLVGTRKMSAAECFTQMRQLIPHPADVADHQQRTGGAQERLLLSAKKVLSYTEPSQRPPVREIFPTGATARVRVHALADLHDAVTALEGAQ